MIQSFQQGDLAKIQGLKPEKRQLIHRQFVQDMYKLNLRWLQEMTKSQAQVREKMSLFRHGHFASKTINSLFDQAMLNVIREKTHGAVSASCCWK